MVILRTITKGRITTTITLMLMMFMVMPQRLKA